MVSIADEAAAASALALASASAFALASASAFALAAAALASASKSARDLVTLIATGYEIAVAKPALAALVA